MSSKKFFNQYSWKALEPFQLCLIMLMVLLPLGLMAQIGSTVSNVAKGKTARQSSGGDPARGSASKSVDGNTSGVWTYDNNTITHTNEENNPWWELDLGGVYDVSEIKIWNRTDDCCWARLQNFYVMLSETPIEASSTTASQYAPGPISFSSATEKSKSLKGNAKGRYVRIFMIVTGAPRALSLAEVEVMGTPGVLTPKTETYVVEMLGRRGTLEFPATIQNKPATAKISMYGLTQSDVKTYNLTNIKWSENTLDADIRDATKPSQSTGIFSGLDASANFIRLYFPGSSKYKVVGALTNPFVKDGIYGGNTSTIIVGYSPEAMSLFPQKTVQKYALVIRDKHAEVKDGKYDHEWYVDPRVAETNTFRELMILRDDLLKELALYEFANASDTEGRTEEGVRKNKILAYDLTEIIKQIKVLFPKTDDYGIKTKLKGDIIALLITEGMKRYPSTVLGLKSTGHGTPIGIMNEFLEEDYLIERSLFWTTEVRKKPIDFIDLNTNCNAGSFYNFKSAAPYTNYILASDLTRYPTNSDDYQTFFNPTTSVQQTLVNILDNESKLQKTSCEGCKKFLMQASLSDAREFKKVADKLGPDAMKKVKDAVAKPENKNLIYLEDTNKQVDFETAVPRIFPSYTTFASDWKKVLLKKIDNRDYVNTGIAKIPEAKGLLFIRVY